MQKGTNLVLPERVAVSAIYLTDSDKLTFPEGGRSPARVPRHLSLVTRHCPSYLIPLPEAIPSSTVKGHFSNPEMQKDLASMVALVGECVTEKSHRA